jgi:hypothetical protein
MCKIAKEFSSNLSQSMPAFKRPGGVHHAAICSKEMMIGMRPDRISGYEALHAASHQGVRDLLEKYHMRNSSIFIHKFEDDRY